MAPTPTFTHFFITILFFLTLLPKPIFSSPSQSLDGNPKFDPQILLLGDAKVIDGASYVRLTRPSVSSSGFLLYKNPIMFSDPNLGNATSFSTEFSFSISHENGDGLALLFVPGDSLSDFPGKGSFGISRGNRFLGIEFDTSMDGNVGDLNANHVGIDLGSLVSVSVANVSALDLVLNSGDKLKSWIDYEASSKRLEVRLGRLGEPKPLNSIISYPIDLSEMWKGEDVFVGLSSSNGYTSQITCVYSWRLRSRKLPSWVHSLPADPLAGHPKQFRKHCPLTLLSGLIFVSGCLALMAFVMLFFWAIFFSRHEGEEETLTFPGKFSGNPENFRYEKVNVVVDEQSEDS